MTRLIVEDNYFDEDGNKIEEFNLIKVFHFKGVNSQGRGRKNYFMYKWVKIKDGRWIALHLNNDKGESYRLCAVADKQTRIINGTKIVQKND